MKYISVLLTVIVIVSCTREKGLQPEPTRPVQFRKHWAVITEQYVPAYAEPSGESEPLTLLREHEVIPITNLRVSAAVHAGERGRWHVLSIDDIGDAWVFDRYFAQFTTREQARIFADRMME